MALLIAIAMVIAFGFGVLVGLWIEVELMQNQD